MGEVWRAVDTRLGREVAVKVLPERFAADERSIERFDLEARAISSLNHPNICALYDVGSDAGAHYLVMEILEGESLAERLRKGPLPLPEVLRYGGEIASALHAAHRRGITHRDLKPANIILTASGAKLVDFGLAKPLADAARDVEGLTDLPTEEKRPPLTREGTIVGTPPYMAPEQLEGGQVDARTDIFALGDVLYEMATGYRPFDGKSKAALIASILTADPEPIANRVPGFPPALDHLVRTCLQKDPDRRWQSAQDIATQLEWIGERGDGAEVAAATPPQTSRHREALLATLAVVMLAGGGLYWGFGRSPAVPPGDSITSVAVLPFENVGGDPDREYLSDGVAETLINSLARLPDLEVTARSTSFRFKGTGLDPLQVGRELGVGAVLTGRVSVRGDNLVVGAELLDVAGGTQLWGERYDRRAVDLASIQATIASEIAGRLRAELTGEERRQLTRGGTESAEAYDLYLKGLNHWDRVNYAGMSDAIEYFQRAGAADPGYALPHLGLADVYSTIGYHGMGMPQVVWPKVKAEAQRALELDETLAGAHAAIGLALLFHDWDFPAAKRALDRALTLDPDSAPTHHWYAHYWGATGEVERSLEAGERAVELEPLHMLLRGHQSYFLASTGRRDELVESCAKAAEVDSTHYLVATCRGLAHVLQGRLPEAIAEFEVAAERSDGSALPLMDLGVAYAAAGRRRDAEGVIEDLHERADRRGYIVSGKVAMIHAVLGETEEAFEWLEKAFVERDPVLLFLKTSSGFEGLRADPRLDDLVRRVGLP